MWWWKEKETEMFSNIPTILGPNYLELIEKHELHAQEELFSNTLCMTCLKKLA